MEIQRYDVAIRCFSAALAQRPSDDWLAEIYRLRGNAYFGQGDRAHALADYDHALRLPAKSGADHCVRAMIHQKKGDYGPAAREYSKAAELTPDASDSWNGIGWIKATAPITGLRNAQEALRAAVKACELTQWQDADCIDTLAAAHAEAGNFDEAIKFEVKAIKLTEPAARAVKERHLASYRQHQPHRDPVGLH